MSNRSLFEINHDLSHRIRARPMDFACDMAAYLASGSPRTAAVLAQYGIRVIGMRHHSEPFHINWGAVEVNDRSPAHQPDMGTAND
jgi:hypothetical protein